MEKRDLGFIIGGAMVGAALGYIVRRIGISKIIDGLKQRDIIPQKLIDMVDELKQDLE